MKTDEERTTEEETISDFLDSVSYILGNNDDDGTSKETALLYLEKNNLDCNDINDLFKAMDNSLEESSHLLKLQNKLVEQGGLPTNLPWLNEAQIENSKQQHGLIQLMLQLRNKKYS